MRRRSLRRLLLAATALTSLASFQAFAGDPREDLDEPKNQDEGRWTLSGIVNRALLGWDDGGQHGIHSVDNPQDSTGFLLEGEFGSEGWTSGLTIGLDTFYASADTVSQLDWDGEAAVVEVPYAFLELGRESGGRENWGELEIGQADSASDEIDNINLAEADAITDASVDNWANQFFLRAAGIHGDHGLATGNPNAFNEDNGGLRWGDFINGKLAGESGRFATYVSPTWRGFEGSVAVGQPQEIFLLKNGDFIFNEKEHGLYSDAAIRYRNDIGAFRVEGGIGGWRDTTEEVDATEPTEDTGFGGSLALRHIATGLNFSVNYGGEGHTDNCEDPGDISGNCRGDDHYLYLKGGIVRDFTGLGETALYAEYHKDWMRQNDSDEGALRTLELNEDQAEELKGSTVTVWGAGIVQNIEPVHSQIDELKLYLGYRHYALDTDLLGAGGGSVPSRHINDFDVVMLGLTASWGGTRDGDNQAGDEGSADEIPEPADQVDMPKFEGGAPVYDWSGLYIGTQAGYFDIDSDGFFATSVDLAFCGGGMLAGGEVGWNFQRGNWVFGVEPDFAFFDCSETNLREERYAASMDFLSTLRGRVGWAHNNVLFYGTGGPAFIHGTVQTSLGGQDVDQHGNEDSRDVSAFGAVIGAGIEWGVTRNLSIKAEALRFFFNKNEPLAGLDEGCAPSVPACLPAPSPQNFFAIDDGFLFRIGANWRLWSKYGEMYPYGARPDYLETPAGPYDWSGFHIGPHFGFGEAATGGGYGGDRMTDPPSGDPTHPAPIDLDFENKGLTAGGQAGFDVQKGHIVFGLEGDVSAVDWDDRFTDFQTHGAVDPQTLTLDFDVFATARARLGWANNDQLYYVTGGLGFLQGEFRDGGGHANTVTPAGLSDFTSPASKDVFAIGGVVGGGIEWGVAPNLSLKAEGLYLAFDKDIDLSGLQGVGAAGDHLKIGDSFAFRVGGNWRPGHPAGVTPPNTEHDGAAPYDWGGLYGGPQFGWGGLVTEGIYNPSGDPFDVANEAIDLTGVSKSGPVGGGQVGLNWQLHSMVLGVEGDVSAVDWAGQKAEFAHPDQSMSFNSDVLATLRGRVGWAQDDLLFYVTGGLAFATAELDNTHNQGGKIKNFDTLGGTAGLGMEWGVNKNLSIKTEGLFLALNEEKSIVDIGSEGDPGDFFLLDDGFVARIGANWQFNSRR